MIRCKKVELRSTDLCTLYAEIDTLRQQLAASIKEKGKLQHHIDLIDADTESLMTDCSTPCFIRVRTAMKQLAAANAEIERLRKIEAAAQRVRTEYFSESFGDNLCSAINELIALAGDGGGDVR